MVQLYDVLQHGIKMGASDIHITTNCKVRFRKNSDLVTDKLFEEPLTKEEVIEMTKEITKDKYDELLREKQVDMSYAIDDLARFRVNAYFQRGTVSITIRTIESRPPTMKELNLPPVFKKMINHKTGLILVTGATGSGKSTTMAAMINEINRTRYNKIITLEDPIEFIFKNEKSLVTQREVGNDVKTFEDGLIAMLRQDPDVIVAGELRNKETISMALKAAETGHLVLATLHTNGAISTVERILGVFTPGEQAQIKLQISKTLRAVISQNLIPNRSGGRELATEVMVVNNAIGNLIREDKLGQIKNNIRTGQNDGMHLMDDKIMELINSRKVDPQVGKKYLLDPKMKEKIR